MLVYREVLAKCLRVSKKHNKKKNGSCWLRTSVGHRLIGYEVVVVVVVTSAAALRGQWVDQGFMRT